MTPILGPRYRDTNRRVTRIRPQIWLPFLAPAGFSKAVAFWRWCHMLRVAAPPGKPVVMLNLDETPLRLLPRAPPGALAETARRRMRDYRGVRHSASKRQERGSLTQVVVVADDDEINAALPTVIIGSERVLTQQRWRAVSARLPPAVHCWRQGRGWITAQSMCAIVRLMARALQPWQHRYRFVLSVDSYRAHLSPSVWSAAARAGFGYLVVPSKMTWALQVCDSHVFSPYKARLTTEYQKALSTASSHPPGDRSWSILMESVVTAWQQRVQRRSWRQAFASNGLHAGLSGVSGRLLRGLGFPAAPGEAQALPTMQDFIHIFPKGTDIPLENIVKVLWGPTSMAEAARTAPAGSVARQRQPAGGSQASASSQPDSPWPAPASATAAAARPTTRIPRGTFLMPGPRPRLGPRTRSMTALDPPGSRAPT